MLTFVWCENFNWFEKLACLNSISGCQGVFCRKLFWKISQIFLRKKPTPHSLFFNIVEGLQNSLLLEQVIGIQIIQTLQTRKYSYSCVKSVHASSYSGPYFPAFGLNTERYGVSLRIQSKCAKLRTRITPNTDISYAMYPSCSFCQ